MARNPAGTGRGNAEVPVRKVVLFSSGVGYFEHGGTVRGDSATELRFKASQINDILKSLVLQDAAGKVGAIIYPSFDPIAKTLKSFQVDITENPTLSALLNQLRGAKVSADLGTEGITGTIMGVEQRKRGIGERSVIDAWMLNLLCGGTIRSIWLDDVQKLELEEAALQAELAKALSALAQARDQDKKPVTIRFEGEGEREVRLGYVVEAPVWKTSYRLILPEEKGDTKPHLQGWAIVENQTENDWHQVRLTLVSGRPISFVQELYEPIYIARPEVRAELWEGLRPELHRAGVAFASAMGGSGGAAAPPAAAPMARMKRARGGGDVGMAAEFSAPMAPGQGVETEATTQQIGELFQYAVENVSLPRQKSAMIPIITDDIEVERLSIYNRQTLARHPLTGARVVNNTGKHLLAGPVTVLDSGSYAGDARIDNLPPGQKRLISFGVDLSVLADARRAGMRTAVETGKIVRGTLSVVRRVVETQAYVFENKGARDKVVIVEHPVRESYRLIETPEPIEKTDTLYRFKVPVPAGTQQTLSVREETLRSEMQAIGEADDAWLVRIAEAAETPAAVREALSHAMKLRQAAAEAEQWIEARRERLQAIATEQQRLRDNLKTAPDKSAYHTRLLNKLNEQETAIEELQGQIDERQKQAEQGLKELEDYLAGLEVG